MNKLKLQYRPSAWHPATRWGECAAGMGMPLLGVALLAAWPGLAPAAVQASPPAAHGFNFAYRSEGARNAAPTQVFDDGRRTYMQFNALDRVPEVWTDESGGRTPPKRLAFHLESPYVVIDQVLPRLRLVIDGENTLLVNQAWSSRPSPHPPAVAKTAPPRIWTDSTPFGPEDPPGPVAGNRAVRPSHELAAAPAAQPTSTRDRPTAGALPVSARAAPAASGSLLAVSDEAEDDDPEGRDAAALSTPEAALATLEDPAALSREALADTQIELMRTQALDMIRRAHEAGDLRAEGRLRRIFSEVAQIALEPQPAGRAQNPRRRPEGGADSRALLALADTRPRSDAPLRDADDSDAAPPAAPGAQRSGLAAGSAVDAAPAASSADPTGPSRDLPGSAGGGPAGSAATGASPAAAPLVFEVRDNQRLSQALGRFLETLGWRLEWESQSDFVVRRGYVVKAPSLKEVLLQTLGEYRLSATLYSGNLVVMVSGGDR